MRDKVLAVIVILLGALSFLILIPQIWWLGLAFAIAGVVTGGATLKTLHIKAMIGVILSIAACGVYMILLGSTGVLLFG